MKVEKKDVINLMQWCEDIIREEKDETQKHYVLLHLALAKALQAIMIQEEEKIDYNAEYDDCVHMYAQFYEDGVWETEIAVPVVPDIEHLVELWGAMHVGYSLQMRDGSLYAYLPSNDSPRHFLASFEWPKPITKS